MKKVKVSLLALLVLTAGTMLAKAPDGGEAAEAAFTNPAESAVANGMPTQSYTVFESTHFTDRAGNSLATTTAHAAKPQANTSSHRLPFRAVYDSGTGLTWD
jgi:hypothetical protein